jgi:hypothetical protein
MSSRRVLKHFKEMREEAQKAQLVEMGRKGRPSGDRIRFFRVADFPDRTSRMLFDLEGDGRGVTGNRQHLQPRRHATL